MNTVQELETQALSVPERAKAITVKTATEYGAACELLKTIKGLRFDIESTFKPIRESAHATWKATIRQQEVVEQPLQEAENLLKPQIAAYLREEERKRHEEQMRIQKAEREREERERLEKAVILDEIGETAMANQVLEEEVYIPPVILPKTAPKVAGISMRGTWSAQVTDLMQLVKAVAAGAAPIQCLTANMVHLNQQARSMQDALRYPGVRAISSSNISAARK